MFLILRVRHLLSIHDPVSHMHTSPSSRQSAFQPENRFILCFVVAWAQLKLAQFSPRRKHETVHRSSSWGMRICRHTRGHFAHDFCSNANTGPAIFREPEIGT